MGLRRQPVGMVRESCRKVERDQPESTRKDQPVAGVAIKKAIATEDPKASVRV